jgi:hypothetical protein
MLLAFQKKKCGPRPVQPAGTKNHPSRRRRLV